MSLLDVVAEVRQGNFKHIWQEIVLRHGFDTIELSVSADALKIQHNGEWIRPSVNPEELAEICELLDGIAITPYILDRRYLAAYEKNKPCPKLYPGGRGMSSEQAMIDHSHRVDRSLQDPDSNFIGNAGKHWVFPLEREELYGWHVETITSTWQGIPLHSSYYSSDLKVIQPRSRAHSGVDNTVVEPTHEDYSMTAIMAHKKCRWNMIERDTEEVYRDIRALPIIWGREQAPIFPALPKNKMKRGAFGERVRRIQEKLIALGLDLGPWGADGRFGPATERAVKEFQRRLKAPITGEVSSPIGYNMIMSRSVLPIEYHRQLPDCPFEYLTNSYKQLILGEIKYTVQDNGDLIITNRFLQENVEKRCIPQLIGISGAPANGEVWINKKIADQVITFFAEVEKEGLLHLILTWDGLGYPRLMRGYTTSTLDSLSSHSWYSAFDINYQWNKLGAKPANWNEKGTVKPLVPIAYDHGIGWGGVFKRKDGMHFSVWKII